MHAGLRWGSRAHEQHQERHLQRPQAAAAAASFGCRRRWSRTLHGRSRRSTPSPAIASSRVCASGGRGRERLQRFGREKVMRTKNRRGFHALRRTVCSLYLQIPDNNLSSSPPPAARSAALYTHRHTHPLSSHGSPTLSVHHNTHRPSLSVCARLKQQLSPLVCACLRK